MAQVSKHDLDLRREYAFYTVLMAQVKMLLAQVLVWLAQVQQYLAQVKR